MVKVSKKVKALADKISKESVNKSEYHPVDRYFLQNYLEEIWEVDSLEFIYCNLENVNNTYTVQLFVCLPELFEDFTIEDLEKLINSFTSVFSFFALITYTYKYLEIDILPLIFNNSSLSKKIKEELCSYLNNQYQNLIKDDDDYFEFENQLYGIDNDQLLYVKQKMLISGILKEALKDIDELKNSLIKFKV